MSMAYRNKTVDVTIHFYRDANEDLSFNERIKATELKPREYQTLTVKETSLKDALKMITKELED